MPGVRQEGNPIKFKINSVICSLNHLESMGEEIKQLDVHRWKVFQCLLIKGENVHPDEQDPEKKLRDATDMVISQAQFQDLGEQVRVSKIDLVVLSIESVAFELSRDRVSSLLFVLHFSKEITFLCA